MIQRWSETDLQISVIIPVYNRADLVSRAIDSVLAQSRPADEVIVVDDGSTDDTIGAVQRFGDRVRMIQQPHSGVSAGRNRGIHEARYDWLAFLDSDDLWKPDKLQRQCKALQEQPDSLVCYTDEEWRKDGRWKNQSKHHQKYSGWIYARCLPLCLISPSSVLLHWRVLEAAGLFDEQLPACEDYDLWLRVCLRFPVLFLAERLIVKQAGDWEQLSTQHSLDRYRIISLDKVLRQEPLFEEQRLLTIAQLVEKCRIYGLGCRKHRRDEEALWAENMALRHKSG